MSARKINGSNSFTASLQTRSLSARDVRIQKNGIEFKSQSPIPQWTEMTVDIETADSRKAHCTGVVVECNGNRHSGYSVSLLFTHVSPKSQAALNSLSFRKSV